MKKTYPHSFIFILKLLMMLFYLACSQSAFAEIYKWVDDKGKVHYGDKAASNGKPVDVTEATAKTGNSPEPDREHRRQKLLEAMDEDRLEKKKKQAKINRQKSKHKARCVNAKDRLRRYERAGSLYDLDKEGNRVTLSNEERQKATQNLSKRIKKYCN